MDEKEEASRSQQDFYQAEEPANEEAQHQQQTVEAEESQAEGDVDPEEPLYGLEQRLRKLNLDTESRRIIREKLDEANQKIKFALEERQKNLDVKLAGGAGAAAPKKK